MARADTPHRILDAAEALFAQHGFAGTSLRAVTTAAGANLAAAHYHFGSKEALFRAVLVRRVEPMNTERLQLLEQVLLKAGNKTPALEKIVEAYVAPPLRLSRDKQRGAIIRKLIGRSYLEPENLLQPILHEQFGPVAARFINALRKALPGVSKREMAWRVHFMLGTMFHAMAGESKLDVLAGGRLRPAGAGEVLERLVRFTAAGIRAGAASRRPRSGKAGK